VRTGLSGDRHFRARRSAGEVAELYTRQRGLFREEVASLCSVELLR
jgi:hypothetical protein